MLVEELYVAIIDTLGNLLSDLMRRATLNHIESRPAVLRLSSRRSTDEEIILQLAL